MDNAVALVRSYLQLNGYFTVTEYPVVGYENPRHMRTITDIDIIAFRFPYVERMIPGKSRRPAGDVHQYLLDEALRCEKDQADMIIGEVKERKARFNPHAFDPAVLKTALMRFGCCHLEHPSRIVQELIQPGAAHLPIGHQVRMVVFGSQIEAQVVAPYHFVSLHRVLTFLLKYIRNNWELVRSANYKDPALAFLVTTEKSRRPDSG